MAADLAFVGGAVFEGLGVAPRSLAVAVKDGRIARVGSDDEIRDEIDASTEVVDVGGGLLTPGFVDAHVHPVYAGYAMLRCELHDVIEANDCISTVAEYARSQPRRPVDHRWRLVDG